LEGREIVAELRRGIAMLCLVARPCAAVARLLYVEAMCGRYLMISPVEVVRQLFMFEQRPNLMPRYNIAPTQDVPTVVSAPPASVLAALIVAATMIASRIKFQATPSDGEVDAWLLARFIFDHAPADLTALL
jgi:hypothetical protein